MFQFKQITTLTQKKQLVEENYARKLRTNKKVDIEELFHGICECRHPKHNHYLGFCSYNEQGWCDCLGYVEMKMNLIVEVRNIDIFRFETENFQLEDSPQFWLDYKNWKDKRDATKNISCSR